MLTIVIHNPEDKEREAHLNIQFIEQEIHGSLWIESVMMLKHVPMGICRSFKKCIRIAQEIKAPCVNIFEDDSLFLTPTAYKQFIEIYEKEVPADCDVYCGGIYDGNPVAISDRCARVEGKLSGLHCIIIPEHYYETILDVDENINLDYILSETLHAKIYCMYPMGIIQKDGYSHNAKQITKYNAYLHTRYKLLKQD